MAGKHQHLPDGASRKREPGGACWRSSGSGQRAAIGSTATLHLLGTGPDHCVVHAQRISFFVTFGVSVILILTLGEKGHRFSFPPKKKKKKRQSHEILFCEDVEETE